MDDLNVSVPHSVWCPPAIAWLRLQAADQAATNATAPRHAACYPSWVARVRYYEALARKLEDEMQAASTEHSSLPGPSVPASTPAAPKQGRIDCRRCNGAGQVRGHLDDCFSALCTLNCDVHSCPGEVQPCPCTKPLNGIRATMFHDEGAIAQCFYCKRYTLNRNALHDWDSRRTVCTCGSNHGWSGSFVKPGPDAQWHGQAPSQEVPRDA